VIDIVPQPFKEFAIATFGANDKIALLAGLGLAVVIASAIGECSSTCAALSASWSSRSPACCPPRPSSRAPVSRRCRSFLPWSARSRHPSSSSCSVAACGSGGGPVGLTKRDSAPDDARALGRRGFFRLAGVAGVSAVIVGVTARVVTAATSSVDAIRDALKLPAPRRTLTVPAGAELDVPGLSPLFTPNADFYRVDTALTVPAIDPSTWRLVVDGMVDRRIELSFDDLVGMGLDEYGITLTCVSNEVGGGLVGNARWLGVPVRDILRMAGPQAGADMVLSRSVDGYTASTPLSALTDDGLDAILAVAMNGEPLPAEHGFPVRMIVPGLYGYVSATKWLTELKVTTFAADEAYWTPRGYSAEAPIKLSSRVDVPKVGSPVAPGRVPVAGMAWAQPTGVARVEVNIDDTGWIPQPSPRR
jgi:DMSO/TMAO reductase YedYZ molybdopterin-dependent catalytic subunit